MNKNKQIINLKQILKKVLFLMGSITTDSDEEIRHNPQHTAKSLCHSHFQVVPLNRVRCSD